MFNSKILNKSLKKNITAPKGIFLKLILSVLSKKGNWPSLLKILNKISLKSRHDLNKQISSKTLTGYSVIPLNKISNLQKATNYLFLKSLNFSLKLKKPNLFVSLKDKSPSDSFKNNVVFSSLRSIHSLLRLITVFIELKNKRRGGRVFSVPVPVKSERRRHSIFIHWMKKTIKDQKRKKLLALLSNELNGLLFKKGKSVDQLFSLEKSIRVNRVFLRKSQIKLI